MSQVTELLVRIKQQGDEQLTRLQSSLKGVAQQTAAANVNFKEVSAELKKIQNTSTQSINNLKGYSSAWREIANSVDVASNEFRQATAEADRLDKKLAEIQGKQIGGRGGRGGIGKAAQIAGTVAGAGVFGGFEGGAGALIGGIVGGVPGAIVGGGIGAQVGGTRQMLSGLASYTAEIEKQRIALRLVTEDARAYEEGLSFINTTSRQFAIPQELITRQFTQLSASVLGAGGNVKDAEIAFRGIAAGIRGTGGSLEDMDAALRATAQVFSKGKVSAEELRQQIGERLPGAFTLFAKSIGMTPQELDKALEDGKVSLQQFQKFAEELFKRYGKNAEIIAKGPQSAGDRLQAALSRMNESVGRLLAPIGAAFQSIFADIVNAITRAANALARFMGMKFYDPERIADLERRIKQQTALAVGPADSMTARRQAVLTQLKKELQEEKSRIPKGQPGVVSRASGLPGIVPDTGKADKEAEREAKKQARLLEQRNNLTRQASTLQSQITDKIVETQEAIDALGASSIEVFEKKYNDRVTDAQKVTKDLLLKVFGLAKEMNERGGKLPLAGIVKDVIKLEDAAQSFAQNEFTQGLGDFFKNLDNNIQGVTESVYENARAMQYNADTLGGLRDGLISYQESIGTTREAFSQLSANGIKGIEEAIFSLTTTGSANFGQFAASILRDTARMIIQQYVLKTIMQALGFPGGGAAAGIAPLKGIPLFNPMGVSGFNPSTFAFAASAKGNVFGRNGIQKFARGGIVGGPTIFPFANGIGLMGEAGPEAIMPLRRGRDGRLGVESAGGGVNVTVNVDAGGSEVQGDGPNANQLGRVIGAAVQAEIVKQQRPGGLLSGTR